MTRARLPMSYCFRGRDRGAQCNASADRGHNVGIQWPVILAVPCLSRYGADATSCPVGHSVVSSRRPAEIAGVVDALMERDLLSERPAEAGARVIDKPASSDTENSCLIRGCTHEASGETEIGLLAEAFRERPRARRRLRSGCRDLPCEA